MVMMSRQRGETSNDKEELVCNKLDDDNNCEAATKQINNSIGHNINSAVDTKKGENEGVDINGEGGKEKDKEFDIDSLYSHEYDFADIDGTLDGTDNGMIALKHLCDDDRMGESNGESKDNNDDFNNDDGGRRGECF